MDIIATILSLISPQAILELPWQVKGPALLILGIMLLSTITSILKFRFIKASFSLFYTIALAIIISNFGQPIASMLDLNDNEPTQTQPQTEPKKT